ncbi:MAG: methionine biosynthesis protein MetW [Alphaproteobacteria bacterium]|nr:methionine biosynthesis protein MetW [Alphaproteobacteria bacterium]
MTLRRDLRVIADMVPAGSRVLDVGCGDGALMAALRDEKGVEARGIELAAGDVAAAVARGLSVVQGDADTDLGDYPADAFDVVILSQTLQATREPAKVLDELLRIGRRAIVSFPNFGHWRVRLSILLGGRMPMTAALPVEWYETPNIHLCSIDDFRALAASRGAAIDGARFLSRSRPVSAVFANLLAEQAVFLLRRG